MTMTKITLLMEFSGLRTSGVQRSGDAWDDCLIGCPLPNSSIQQWRMVVIVTRYTMFVTSQYDVILTFANQRFGEVSWHNVHIQGRRSSGRGAVPSPRRTFCGFSSPKKAPRPPNWIMKHCKSVKFNQISECQAPWTDVEPPVENFLATVLLGRGSSKTVEDNGNL